jgi:uncharacterized protein YjbI with pentapeptide repeats
MTETLPELLCSDAWWQRVGPALSADGRALVKETLTQAAAKLDDKEKEKFTEALTALRAPSEEQLAWLRDVAAVPNLEDLSNILICHPDTGAPINLENHQLPAVTFKGAVFAGKADFGRATFMGEANFMEAMFTGEANFWGAKFAGKANFWKATFAGKASFTEATFAGEIYFLQATFTAEANFWKTTFTREANFIHAKLAGEANFWGAKFAGKANFWKATFAGKARFTEATFTGEAQFLQATFMSEADFQHAEFLGITIFREAHFKQVASFHAARFSKTVSFRGSDWGAVPDFIGTAWKDGVAIADFVQLQTQLNKGELDWRNPSTSDPAPITDRLQALRKMARDADDRPRELDYFALELQARYQGKGAWAKRFLVNLYGWFSDYGRGILLPFLWLLVLWLLFALGYLCLAVGGCALLTVPVALKEPLLLSLVNILPTLGAGSMARESSLKALYGCDVPTSVHLIAVVEGVIGLILLFLIALGLRNRFRL